MKTDDKKQRTANRTFKKLAVQWLIEALCFVSSSVVADSFRLRNRQLLVAANRYSQVVDENRITAFRQQSSLFFSLHFKFISDNLVMKPF
jgi:hypothetical protein